MKVSIVRLNVHERAALMWVGCAAFVFEPIARMSPRPHVGLMLAEGIALVTACIGACPLLLRWSLFRRLFCWTDAMSPEQRTAWGLNSKAYYRAASESHGYVNRLNPYLLRILGVAAAAGAIQAWVSDIPVLMFLTWYPLGVLVLASVSMPWTTMFFKR